MASSPEPAKGRSRPNPGELPPAERAAWERVLARWHRQYDPEVQMIRRPFSSPGYHTTLTGGEVHPTRESLAYAVACLDAGAPALVSRAEAILARVAALQDPDPASRTFGIWPWFLEEPLAQMSPPDWNWADFCGVQLAQVLLDHADRIAPEVGRACREALGRAAEAIRRRDVGPGYTNIALMGTYVTLVAGRLLERPDLADYGRQRLRRIVEHTRFHGSFTEYNSPTYTVVALQEIGRILAHVPDPEVQALGGWLYGQAWRHVARRWHHPSGQWAGPHSRSYSTLLRPATLSFLQAATGHRLRLVPEGELELSLDWVRLPLRCPEDLLPLFGPLVEPRTEVEVLWRPEGADPRPPLVGTTYLTPAFALGSVNREILWNQRRALVAYWGSPQQPAYLHLRCLHDGYDFSAAHLFAAQQAGAVLLGIAFAVDGGDRHPSLDKIRDGTIQARELVVRLEVGGGPGWQPPADCPRAWDGSPVSLPLGPVRLWAAAPLARFDQGPVRYEAGRTATEAWLDVVLYRGEPKAIHLAELEETVAVLALSLAAAQAPAGGVESAGVDPAAGAGEEPPVCVLAGGRAQATWRRPGATLAVTLPVRPLPAAQLQREGRAEVWC